MIALSDDAVSIMCAAGDSPKGTEVNTYAKKLAADDLIARGLARIEIDPLRLKLLPAGHHVLAHIRGEVRPYVSKAPRA